MRVSRRAAAARSATMSSTVFVRDRREAEVDLRETLRVEKSIDLDDLPFRDGEGHDRQDAAVRRDDGPAAPFMRAGLTNG
jgi:hypothetical protein